MERWQKLSDVPSGYYRTQVQRLSNEGILAGTSDGLNITEDMLRTILITERIVDQKKKDLEKQIEKLIKEWWGKA